MKVKVNVDIHLDIPGEFQDDNMAVSLIDQTLRDMLYVGVDYEEEEMLELPINEIKIRSYFVLAGRVPKTG